MIRIAKQPNEKYCIWAEGQMYINQTENDYYNFVLEETRRAFATPGFIDGVNLIIKNVSDDKLLKEMGFKKTHSELMKYIPKLVVNQSYYGRDCTTYGSCPTCKAGVKNGIGGKDDVCEKCGQHLTW